jgi:hypothetical protein
MLELLQNDRTSLGLRTRPVAEHARRGADQVAGGGVYVRLSAIDTRIAEIDKRLAVEFPDYSALVGYLYRTELLEHQLPKRHQATTNRGRGFDPSGG